MTDTSTDIPADNAEATGASDDVTVTTLLGSAQAEGDKAEGDAEKPAEGDTKAEGEEKPKAEGDTQDEDKPKDDLKAEGDDVVPEGNYAAVLDAEAFPGIEINNEVLERVSPILKAKGFTQGEFNQLLPEVAGLVAQTRDATQQAVVDAIATTRKAWADASLADTEIGGTAENLARSRAVSAKAIDHFGGVEFRKFLDETGLGNHPQMIRTMRKVGEEISESTFHPPGDSQERTNVAPEAKLYDPAFLPKGER